ncbi:Outer membrane efflux protein [Posidoniimonas polymericola]|uniref:Outer membrane efflux protein n=1 Tax=Posidoniimonas polymericola TaxID=2528002 RepID=A0A5C5YEH1_9BACT|nr:TolC family protein [Posidoniimonas polymericola]TWT72705.1 Outer membrane efflux protein [Posidoniimonas polymericola]
MATGRYSSKLLSLLLALVGVVGCSRTHYRLQADSQANCVVDQKAPLAGSEAGRYRIGIHPASRMFDPNDPDQPPMPPDDPASNTILQCVDGKRGAKQWQNAEQTPFIENPNWTDSLPLDEEGRLVLDLPAAVQTALLHAPDYQEEVEDLYLSALDVTFERFRFDTQFFGGSSVFYTADGHVRSGIGQSASTLNVTPFTSSTQLQKLGATGSELVVGLANSLVWQFSGPDNYASTTLLDFTLVQPLLRGAGRAVVLERLTIAERTLLANVRSMERYRSGYYLEIAIGRDAGDGASRRGGFFGGAGLEGFTGVGGGGFGRIGGFNGGGNFGGGGGITGGAGAAAASGYVGLLQSQQVLLNQQANVAALRESVEQLVASYDAGRIDRFQVDLARQALYNAQSQLLQSEAGLQGSLDSFKITLGLPPDLPLVVDDDLLSRFNLRDESLVALQTDATVAAGELRERIREASEAATEASDPGVPEPNSLPSPVDTELEAVPKPAEVILAESEFNRLAAESLAQLAVVRADVEQLEAILPSRREHLQQLATWDEVAMAGIDPDIFSPARLDKRFDQLRRDLDVVAERIDRLAGRVASVADAAEQSGGDEVQALREATSQLSSALLELSLLQARARLDAIDTPPTELTPEDALAIASFYRRDWMNNRAALVDTWRLVTFNANDLRSDLDVVFSGDIGNVGDNPLALRGSNGRLRVGLQFDAPLTRLSERNVYVQSLIEYQQGRRAYYRYVDRLYQGLRATLRQVRLNEINLELRREAVLVAIAQVDITQLRLFEPPKPGEEAALSNTTARDLVQALSDLLNVQNDFLSVWVNNEVQRLNLEWDLGLMQVDERGIRIPLQAPFRDFLAALPCPDELRPWAIPEVAEPAAEPAVFEFPAEFSSSGRHTGVQQASWEEYAERPRRLPQVAIP